MNEHKRKICMNDVNKEFALRAHDRHYASTAFDNESTVSIAIVTLKSLLLINGGASIAMLGFVSSLVSEGDKVVAAAADPIIWFALGVAASVFACCISYAVMYFQAAYSNSLKEIDSTPFVVRGENSMRFRNTANVLQILAVLVAFASLVFFLIGIFAVSCAIETAF